MENTKENKERFFAQYWGQKIGGTKYTPQGLGVNKSNLTTIDFLLLTPLSLISDEDAIEVAKVSKHLTEQQHYDVSDQYFFENKTGNKRVTTFGGNTGREFIICETMCSASIDRARKLGYALPWNGISVEHQVEFGWVKLKTE